MLKGYILSGNVGVHAMVLETEGMVSYNANQNFPMQSVYKFPIAMTVLDKVESQSLLLKDMIESKTGTNFISDSYATQEERDQVIANISKTIFKYWGIE